MTIQLMRWMLQVCHPLASHTDQWGRFCHQWIQCFLWPCLDLKRVLESQRVKLQDPTLIQSGLHFGEEAMWVVMCWCFFNFTLQLSGTLNSQAAGDMICYLKKGGFEVLQDVVNLIHISRQIYFLLMKEEKIIQRLLLNCKWCSNLIISFLSCFLQLLLPLLTFFLSCFHHCHHYSCCYVVLLLVSKMFDKNCYKDFELCSRFHGVCVTVLSDILLHLTMSLQVT